MGYFDEIIQDILERTGKVSKCKRALKYAKEFDIPCNFENLPTMMAALANLLLYLIVEIESVRAKNDEPKRRMKIVQGATSNKEEESFSSFNYNTVYDNMNNDIVKTKRTRLNLEIMPQLITRKILVLPRYLVRTLSQKIDQKGVKTRIFT